MVKVTLDRETFKALASETRLNILRVLDGKKLSLKDICDATSLNKATLYEHLLKLSEAGLVKRKEREGHKWVYYKLTWKGENLLHPENAKIVVLFTVTFIALFAGIVNLFLYVRGSLADFGNGVLTFEKGRGVFGDAVNDSVSGWEGVENLPENSRLFLESGDNGIAVLYQDPLFLYVGVVCLVVFTVVLCFALWRFWENRTPRL
jgi:DNA-binding transcriptional ArsR family regulator